MLIFGIDPGLCRTGIGLIANDGSGKPRYLAHDLCLPLPKLPMQERLAILYRFVQHSLDKYARNGSCVVAVEKTFVAHNSASSLALAMARGALLTACANYTVYEYSPATIKRIVAGNGQADKEAVLAALPTLLKDLPPVAQLTTQGGGKRTPLYDASDALAIALCCALRDGGGERLSA